MKRNLKGIMGVLLSATLFAGAIAASPAMAGTSADMLVKADENAPDGAVTYIYGDVDLNNKLEAVDALAILKHVVKLTTLDGELVLELADVDHDASIAAADALAVLKCVVGLQTPAYYTVTPPASEVPPATESANPEPPAPSETVMPTETAVPSEAPTPDVTAAPTETAEPTVMPTETVAPTATPDVTAQPTETVEPTATPDVTGEPTETVVPTVKPTDTPKPTITPTAEPTATPDITAEPTDTPAPTVKPTAEPTVQPTETPAPHVHNYTSTITLEATCGKDGVETFTCECGDTFKKPIPATGEHTYEKTYEKVTIVDKEAQYAVKTPHTVWVCVCGEEFDGSKGCTVDDLIAHAKPTNLEVAHHSSSAHKAAGYVFSYDTETKMCSCTCGWSHYTDCGSSSTYLTYTYEDIPAVTHEEIAIVNVCSICGATKEYEYSGNADTCTHDWYVEREAWSEDVEEKHVFCACGYDCGIDDGTDAAEKATDEAWFNHISQYDMTDNETYWQHYYSKSQTVTVTYTHDAIYRCALCGAHRDASKE